MTVNTKLGASTSAQLPTMAANVYTAVSLFFLPRKQVGDSLAHDIVGASSAGLDSVFIAGGICGEELGIDAKADKSTFNLSPDSLESAFSRENVTPTWTMPLFAL